MEGFLSIQQLLWTFSFQCDWEVSGLISCSYTDTGLEKLSGKEFGWLAFRLFCSLGQDEKHSHRACYGDFWHIHLQILGTEATLHRDLFPVFSLKDTVLGSFFSKQDSSMFMGFFLETAKGILCKQRDSRYWIFWLKRPFPPTCVKPHVAWGCGSQGGRAERSRKFLKI